MKRAICQTEPKYAVAGEVSSWKFLYTPSQSLPKGTKIRFDLQSKGREFDWEPPETSAKAKGAKIWLEADGVRVEGKAVPGVESAATLYEFVLPKDVKGEEPIEIVLSGSRAQTFLQRKRPFHLYIDPKGKGDFKESEIFSLDVRGGKLESIRVIIPSMVAKNQRFDVVLRFEDHFGNLTGHAPAGTLIELTYDQLRENLNWKLFVPETGFIALPNLYFNEEGVYRLKLYYPGEEKTFYSTPIICFNDLEHSLYWGLFHGEALRYDAKKQIESCLRHVRDDKAFHFYATSTFESEEEMPTEMWKSVSTQIAEFNEEDRFTTFLGEQWFGEEPGEGLRQLLLLKDSKPLLRKKDSKTSSLKKIYKSHTVKDVMGIPCFTMGSGFQTDFSDHNPEFEPVVEIYNAWGSSECLEKEGNPRPIKAGSRKGISEHKAGSIREALNRGCRFGFVAGGFDERGLYAPLAGLDQVQYTPGLTAVLASSQSREGYIEALQKRRCYATTGERILLGYTIAGKEMGSVLSTREKPGLAFVRYFNGFVVGTADLDRIEVLRNGEKIHEIKTEGNVCRFEWEDVEPIENHALNGDDEHPAFVYYYLRVFQKDGHIAWGSPIWIELTGDMQSIKRVKKKK